MHKVQCLIVVSSKPIGKKCDWLIASVSVKKSAVLLSKAPWKCLSNFYNNNNNNTHWTVFIQDYPGEPVPER